MTEPFKHDTLCRLLPTHFGFDQVWFYELNQDGTFGEGHPAFAKSAVNPQLVNLLTSAPLMYRDLAKIAALAAAYEEYIDAAHANKELSDSVYNTLSVFVRTLETICLNVTSVAIEGIGQTIARHNAKNNE